MLNGNGDVDKSFDMVVFKNDDDDEPLLTATKLLLAAAGVIPVVAAASACEHATDMESETEGAVVPPRAVVVFLSKGVKRRCSSMRMMMSGCTIVLK